MNPKSAFICIGAGQKNIILTLCINDTKMQWKLNSINEKHNLQIEYLTFFNTDANTCLSVNVSHFCSLQSSIQ